MSLLIKGGTLGLAVALRLTLPTTLIEAESTDGQIVSRAPCVSNVPANYRQYVQAFQASYLQEVADAKAEGFQMNLPADPVRLLPNSTEFTRMKAYRGFGCSRITYLSDGLQVIGFIWKPTNTTGKRLPLIIFNRGGSGDFGKIGMSPTPVWSPWDQFGFYKYVSSGFVVIASQ